MAVALIAAIQQFLGASSDTKPTTPPVGSTFYEADTQAELIFDGSAWRRKP